MPVLYKRQDWWRALRAFCVPQVAFEPLFLRPYMELGVQSDLVVQDSSAFAAPGEQLSFLQLQASFAALQAPSISLLRA